MESFALVAAMPKDGLSVHPTVKYRNNLSDQMGFVAICAPEGMNSNDFSNSMAFLLVPPSGEHFYNNT